MVESMTFAAIEDGRTVRSVTLKNAQWQRVVDATTGEVLTPTRELVTVANPDERYPVPEDALFIDGETADFIDAPDLEAIAEALIEVRPPLAHIERFTVAFLWKRVGGSEGGKARFGQCVRPSGLARFYGKVDFAIWLAADHCRDAGLSRWQVEALLCHELLHCDESDKGGPAIRPHDFQGFDLELAWYGSWQSDLQRMVRVARQLPLIDGEGPLWQEVD